MTRKTGKKELEFVKNLTQQQQKNKKNKKTKDEKAKGRN